MAMVVDILVSYHDWWWPVAWGIIFLEDEKVLIIKESPYNAHARGEAREEEIGGNVLVLYENQTAEVWDSERLFSFLRSLEEREYEIEVSERVHAKVHHVLSGKWWTTSYPIYM